MNAYLPSPLDIPPVKGTDPKTGDEIERPASDEAPFSALAFKIAADPFVGKLAFFRVYSGSLKSGSYILNSSTGERERIGRILRMHANSREEVAQVYAGEIAAAVDCLLEMRAPTASEDPTLRHISGRARWPVPSLLSSR